MNFIFTELSKSFNNIFNTFFKKIKSVFFKFKNGPVAAIRKFTKKLTKLVFKKESSLKDYIRAGGLFISKRLLILLLAVLIFAITCSYKFLGGKLLFDKNLYLTDKTAFSGNVKMYNDRENRNLIYKGALLNGQYEDDNGKLYFMENASVLKYTGGFKSGKFTGFGTLYGFDSSTLYEGYFENDLYEGKGILYHQSGEKKYQGNFKNGLFNGDGIEFDTGGNIKYQGMFENNLPEGKCKEFYASGNVKYDGNFFSGLYNGFGTLFDENEEAIYTGDFKNGLYDGSGDLYDNGILVFSGNFKKGVADGAVKEYDDEGNLKFVGTVVDGKYFGKGTLYNDNGNKSYEGEFLNGKLDGEGVLYSDNELNTELYSGSFKNDMYSGFGESFDDNGDLLYEGEFSDGLYDGSGISYENKKTAYIGDFKNGLYDGHGKLLNDNEQIIYEGEFAGGYYDGFGSLYNSSGSLEYKGFFKANDIYIEGYLNIAEALLKEYLEEPDNTVVNDDNSLDLYYNSLGYIFNVKLDDLKNGISMVVDSMKITSSTEIDGINTSMTASIVQRILDNPDVDHEIENADDPESSLYEMIYYRQNYALYIVFSNYKTQMNYMLIKRYENQ